MSWSETSPTKEHVRFIRDGRSGPYSMTNLCLRFGIVVWLAERGPTTTSGPQRRRVLSVREGLVKPRRRGQSPGTRGS